MSKRKGEGEAGMHIFTPNRTVAMSTVITGATTRHRRKKEKKTAPSDLMVDVPLLNEPRNK